MNCKVCQNLSAKNPSLSFFRFPSDYDRCRDWAKRCDILPIFDEYGPEKFYKSFRICSDHFDSKYVVFDGRKNKLLACAVPKEFHRKEPLRKIADHSKNKNPQPRTNSCFTLKPFRDLCRFCAEECTKLTDIYSWRGKTLKLEDKIKVFPITVRRQDELPLRVCRKCVAQLTKFHEFVNNCMQAEIKLQKILKDYKQKILGNSSDKIQKGPRLADTKKISDKKPVLQKKLKAILPAGHQEGKCLILKEYKNPELRKTKYICLRATIEQEEGLNQILRVYEPKEYEGGQQQENENKKSYSGKCEVSGSQKEDHSSEPEVPGNQEEDHLSEPEVPGNQEEHLSEPEVPGNQEEEHLSEPEVPGNQEEEHLSEPEVPGNQEEEHLSEPEVPGNQEEDHLSEPEVSGNQEKDHSNENSVQDKHLSNIYQEEHEHLNTNRYTCSKCLKHFTTFEILQSHEKAHSLEPDEQGRFVCQTCGKVFQNRYRLNEHNGVHTGECPYKCSVCDKRFHKRGLLRQHSMIHESEKRFACSMCNLRSNRRGNMIQHLKNHYKKLQNQNSGDQTNKQAYLETIEPSECKKMRLSTENSNAMSIVPEEEHPPATESSNEISEYPKFKFVCGLCREEYPDLESLGTHFEIHTGENCNSPQVETPLEVNQDRSDERAVESKKCVKKTGGKKKGDERNFQCEECGAKFKRRDTLTIHFRIHTGERPYMCKICGFTFKQRGDCLKHERNHSRDDDYQIL